MQLGVGISKHGTVNVAGAARIGWCLPALFRTARKACGEAIRMAMERRR